MDDTNLFSNPEVLPSNYLGMTVWIKKPEMEDDPAPLKSLPLCFESFQMAKREDIGHEYSPFHMMEQSVDQVCIMDDIPPMNKLPKYDQYDDDYVLQTQDNTTKQSVISLWDKDSHFQQLKFSDKKIPLSYDSEEESAKSLGERDGYLPLCCNSF